MPRSRSLTLLAAVAALGLGLTACSPQDGGSDSDAESPLSEYLSAVWGSNLSDEEWQERHEREEAEIQKLIAECMAEEGFEYVPQSSSVSYSSGAEWDPESEEWVSQWGYGAVNWPGQDDPPLGDDEVWVDPNQDYIESLSESEQAAYWETLHGRMEEPQPGDEEMHYEYRWEDHGCYGWADHQVRGTGEESLYESEEFASLFEAMDGLWMNLDTAPGMSELNAAWADCMTEAGYSGFSVQADASNSIYDELNKFYEEQSSQWENIEDPENFDWESLPDPRDDPAMQELGEREVELALADLACRKQTDYRAESQRIQFALEEQFIEDHRAELDALKAAAEQRS
ncbi:hypothetical protein [Microbacterium album]|uniref:Uncharacterized protein n=1 Tax=Microbacterium album TaxID=2053191 RepID=A0A917IEU5_9MICO|nr:hypothetical protein [Microbacterium album]GGH46073.1 hypothetical protein GCM10010921_21910 [Microbacterium album]